MMVMNNIERFSRNLDTIAEILAYNDSIATWLVNKPIEDLKLMPEKELNSLIDQATDFTFLSRNKSAENILPTISKQEKQWQWNKRVNNVNETILNIKDHPDNYEGNNIPIKIL